MASHQIERTQYLEQLDMFRDKTNTVKIITGVRRCGKSTLLDQYSNRLTASGVPKKNIFRMNLESAEFYDLVDYKALTEHIYSNISKNERYYVFLDEIQRVAGWERTVNSIMVDMDVDLYITGSNSHLLSSELSTYLTGRYTSVNMLPFSFKEFLELHSDSEKKPEDLLWLFITYGGFPSVDPTEGDTFARRNIQDLYSSIVMWDVVSRGDIRNPSELGRLIRHMMINIGNPTSIRKIVAEMGDIHRETVEKYLSLIEEAFILYRAEKYDLKSTALHPTPKYYSVDQGLRNMALGYDLSDLGRIVENIVFLELIRRGFGVTVGKWGAKEIDFVATSPLGEREYIQVCYDINAENVKEREMGALRNITDSFPKTVISMHPPISYVTDDGIRVVNLMDWLLR